MSSTTIPVLSIDNIQWLKSLFDKHIDHNLLAQYKLPVTDDRARVIDASERVLALKSGLRAAPKATGTLIWEGLYMPSKTVAQEAKYISLHLFFATTF
jgi:hypothetical protein